MDCLSKVLIRNINTILARDGISALELDRRAGLSQGRIAAIRRGMMPGVDAVIAIAQYAEVSVDWLVTDHRDDARKAAAKEESSPLQFQLEFHVARNAAAGDSIAGRIIE